MVAVLGLIAVKQRVLARRGDEFSQTARNSGLVKCERLVAEVREKCCCGGCVVVAGDLEMMVMLGQHSTAQGVKRHQ